MKLEEISSIIVGNMLIGKRKNENQLNPEYVEIPQSHNLTIFLDFRCSNFEIMISQLNMLFY